MKKISKPVSLIMVLAMLFALAACSQGGSAAPSASSAVSSASSAASGQSGAGSTVTSGDTGSSGGKVYTLRAGTASNLPDPQNVMLDAVKKRIEAATDQIVVQNYNSSSLGTNAQMIQGLQDGSVQAVCLPTGQFVSSIPELGVFSLPMFFAGGEQAHHIVKTDEKIKSMLNDMLGAKYMIPGAFLRSSDLVIISNKPIRSYSDFKGLKIWCSSGVAASINALGATAVNFDSSDLTVSIQQKTVDGAYSGASWFNALKMYESADYLMSSKKSINFNLTVYMLSKPWMDSLPADLRDIVMQCCADAEAQDHNPYTVKYLNDAFKALVDNGMELNELDDASIDQITQALSPIAQAWYDKNPSGHALFNACKEAIDKA